MAASPEPLAYSVPDAARAIGVSKNMVWTLLRTGELRSFKLGARTLIAAQDLRVLVEQRLRVGEAPP
jgi:excisionase family DNA binding protein